MSQHTPGPWTVEKPSAGSKFPIIQGANWSGEVATVHGDTGEDEAIANAHLIAAAPEMKDLLVRIERHLIGIYRAMAPGGNLDDGNRFADQDIAVEEIRALLGKLS